MSLTIEEITAALKADYFGSFYWGEVAIIEGKILG